MYYKSLFLCIMLTAYSKMVSGDDAGALVDDKEDSLWTPGARSPHKQDTRPDKRPCAQSSDDERGKKTKTTGIDCRLVISKLIGLFCC